MTNKYTDKLPRHLSDEFFDLIDDTLHQQAMREGIDTDNEEIFDAWYEENWTQVFTAYMEQLLPNLSLTIIAQSTKSDEHPEFKPWFTITNWEK